jgi:hypothetical protein
MVDGGDQNDTIEGDAGDDTIDGGFNEDQLFGNDGANVFLNADGEADSLDGGDGVDITQEDPALSDDFTDIDAFYDLLEDTVPAPAAAPIFATTPSASVSSRGTLALSARITLTTFRVT